MAFYTRGQKKPLNLLEAPVYPDIKQTVPRFQWSRKFWQVDVGATMRDLEHRPQFLNDAVLSQPRDYNQTVYGVSSHKDIVNAAFRPPLLDPYEDFYPLTRIPATTKVIIPHINPGTDSDNGTTGYRAKNNNPSGIEKSLTDRVSTGNWRPTFYAPIDQPIDNSVLPDLNTKNPPISAHSGWNMPVSSAPCKEVNLDYQQITPLINTGFETSFRTRVTSELEDIELKSNRPAFSAGAGMNTPVMIDGEYNPVFDLKNGRPQVSADAGMNTPVMIDGEMRQIELDEKLDHMPLFTNPGSEEGFQQTPVMMKSEDEYIVTKRPNVSYSVPQDTQVRSRNEMTYRPDLREKLQPEKSYGKVSYAGAKPMGLYVPNNLSLKEKKNYTKMGKSINYRF